MTAWLLFFFRAFGQAAEVPVATGYLEYTAQPNLLDFRANHNVLDYAAQPNNLDYTTATRR